MGLFCVYCNLNRASDKDNLLTDEIKGCSSFNLNLVVDANENTSNKDRVKCYFHFKSGTILIIAQNIEAEVKVIDKT